MTSSRSGVFGIFGLAAFSCGVSSGTAASASLATLIASSAWAVFSTLAVISLAAGVGAFDGSGLPTDEVAVEVVLDAAFLVAPIFALLGFLLRVAVFRGGVVGAFSATLLALACVGRIILARKPSSTLASFLGTGWSLATCFGGGPILGRCLPATEDDLTRLFPDDGRDDLLVDRGFVISCSGEAPFFVLEPDAAVWVVKLGGSLMGRVGDFGLGLTNPPGETVEGVDFFSAAGFLSTDGVLDRFEGTSVVFPAGFGCDEGVEDFPFASAGVDAFVLSAPFRALVTLAPLPVPRAAPVRLMSLPWLRGPLLPIPVLL